MKALSNGVMIFLALLLLPRALELLFPFLIGFFLYLICRRSVRRMVGAGLNRSFAAAMALAFVLALILAATALCLAAAYGERDRLPGLLRRISTVGANSPLLGSLLETFRTQLDDTLRALSLGLLSKLGDAAKTVMILLFAFLSAFFFLRDEEKLVDIIRRNAGSGFLKNVCAIRRTAGSALIGYIRAQLIIMTVIFGLLAVFLTLLGIERSVLVALATAFLDAIPVFGTGFVLLPWAAWELLTGHASLGFGLIALYGACSLTRQLLEPRILSSQIGLHPLLTLAGIFIGYRLFGIPGLIIGPASVLIIVTYVQKAH